ncbi:unnamed protein product [Cuscuta europaea]|uniref:RING-type domain-containing protein n=1 Tax=Cuscuta europaea TaxID=41803 RepID=A0A9P1DWU0_CUSEU|nr:unnamed protein product [Cuscuta europaea]
MAVQTWFYSQDPFMASSKDGAFSSQGLLQQIPESRSPNPFPPPFPSHLEKQSLEMDLFLQFENQKLREMVVEEQRRQQRALLRCYETKAAALMRQKDLEIAMAKNKNRELQDFLIGAEVEAKLWERKAAENETIATELSNRLRQVITAERESEQSFCGGGGGVSTSALSEGMGCKVCQSRRVMSVVFLPCRHLCCCKSCDVFLELCPVCAALKEDSLEVFLA